MTSFTVSRFVLAGLVSRAAPVVPSGNFRPVLQNFLISVAPGHLSLSATDLDLAITVTTQSVTAEDEATFLLPAARLAAILKEAPEGEVTITAEGTKATVTAGPATWELRLSPDEFPVLPDLGEAEFATTGREELLTALRTVQHAVPPDSVSPAQACIVIAREGDGSARVTAFGSSRYQQARLKAFPCSLLIPALGTPSAADEVRRLLGSSDLAEAAVAETGPWTAIRCGAATLAFKRPLARPADSGRLLATVAGNTQSFMVSRDALAAAIRRVRVAADEKTSAIGLHLTTNSLTVTAQDMYQNTAAEQVPAQWDGKALMLAVHHKFLLEMLAVHPASECRFFLAAGKRAPILLRDEAGGVTGIIGQLAHALAGAG